MSCKKNAFFADDILLKSRISLEKKKEYYIYFLYYILCVICSGKIESITETI